MIDKLAEINDRFEKLTHELGKPDVLQDQNRFRKLSQEHSSLQEIVDCYQQLLNLQEEIEYNKELADSSDEEQEIRQMAGQEVSILNKSLEEKEKHIQFLLIPKDPNDKCKHK